MSGLRPDRRDFLALAGLAATAGSRPFAALQAEDSQASGELPAPSGRVARFERLAFGLFLHWGLYSQLGRGEWAKKMQGIETAEYMELMKSFDAANFDGRELARAAKRSGMRYITLTSRHHDGFSLYDTRGLSPYDVTHTPAKRDLIANFVEGCRAEGILPMLYHTTLDWTEPRFESDFPAYVEYLRASVEILCTQYGPIGGLWFDGNWSREDADWKLDELYGLVRKHQPQAMIINNTGLKDGGRIGHPEIDSVTFERGRPKPLDRRGHGKYVSGEMCHTLNFHWGIAENDFNYLSPAHVIEELCGARRAGANLLLNVGPTAGGALPDYERALLARVGEWIALTGGGKREASPLYDGRSTILGEDGDFGLERNGELYLFVTGLTRTADTRAHQEARGPGERRFRGVTQNYTTAEWLDSPGALEFQSTGDELVLNATGYPYGTNTVVRVAKLS